MSRRPDFIGLGGQRSGTAWLYNCLEEHPSLCLLEKEINYFVHEDKFSKGSDWYESRFASCGPGLLTGEMSSLYLYHPDAPARIREHNPDARLIVSLRNPIDRTYSAYLNMVAATEIPQSVSFETALDDYPDLIAKSCYADGLERYLALFPREQQQILVYDDGLDDPVAFVRSIYRFLGVDDAFESTMAGVRLNLGRIPRSAKADRALDKVGDLFRSAGLRGPLRWMKRTGLVGAVRRVNAQQAGESMPSRVRQSLAKRFAEDVGRVSKIIDRPLESWLENVS
jgi:hypothetical protein